MNKTFLTMVPALGFALLMTAGCSEEAQTELAEAADAVQKDASSALDDAKDSGGEMKDSIQEQAESAVEGIKDKAAEKADEVKDAAADKVDEVKEEAGDMVAELSGKATDMIDQVKQMIADKDFSKAQELLNQLKELPGLDKLPQGLQDQIANLQGMIDKGKEMAGAASGLLGN